MAPGTICVLFFTLLARFSTVTQQKSKRKNKKKKNDEDKAAEITTEGESEEPTEQPKKIGRETQQ
jgi:hypothetical protein